jgi:hypothetical protein
VIVTLESKELPAVERAVVDLVGRLPSGLVVKTE